jgi:hypothetical protein
MLKRGKFNKLLSINFYVAWHPSGKTQENHPFLCLGLMCGQM